MFPRSCIIAWPYDRHCMGVTTISRIWILLGSQPTTYIRWVAHQLRVWELQIRKVWLSVVDSAALMCEHRYTETMVIDWLPWHDYCIIFDETSNFYIRRRGAVIQRLRTSGQYIVQFSKMVDGNRKSFSDIGNLTFRLNAGFRETYKGQINWHPPISKMADPKRTLFSQSVFDCAAFRKSRVECPAMPTRIFVDFSLLLINNSSIGKGKTKAGK